MSMFKSLDELIEELYEEFGEEFDDYLIDELMDALEELAVKYQNETNKSEHDDYAKIYGGDDCECDGDCEHCEYGHADDSDEYEYGNLYGDEHNIIYGDELAEALERAHGGLVEAMDEYDSVNHPAHYCSSGIECIDEMVLLYGKEETMSFCKLNAHKYLVRADHKNGDEDLAKRDWYLNKYAYLDSKPEDILKNEIIRKYGIDNPNK